MTPRLLLGGLAALALLVGPAAAQDPLEAAFGIVGASSEVASEPSGTDATAPGEAVPDDLPGLGLADEALDEGRLSTAVEIAILLTVLTLLPAILITVTSFTRIVIVLSFVRRALSINELPPTQVIIGLALFLTTFVMAPGGRARPRPGLGALPRRRARRSSRPASGPGTSWRGFLVANTRESELALFARDGALRAGQTADAHPPLRVVVPAFVLSELKTSFQMGFLLFLPFLVIDMVVASVLLSMGMFMLPPVMISTPFKILLFVLVDGWHLVCESLVTSFVTT